MVHPLQRAFERFGPSAMPTLERMALMAVNGLAYATEGLSRPQIGNVPKDVVFRRGKLELSRLRPLPPERVELGHERLEIPLAPRHALPVLLVPPLMVRPFVYDLRPEHSLVRTLRNSGFDVFVLDFGVPDDTDEGIRLDDYVLDFVPTCVSAALGVSGAPQLHLAGYCMGGIFSLLHAATFQDPRVRSLVTIGAPVNFNKMGAITMAARWGFPMLDTIVDQVGNVPGELSSFVFRLLGGPRAFTKGIDLVLNLHDEQYVRAYDAIDTWMTQMIPYPKEAFRQVVRDVVYGNKLLKNELEFGGRPADLRTITCPILAFAGTGDTIATPKATSQIMELVGSQDKTYVPVPGGHVGVVGGASAPRAVWEPMARWLAARSS